jgi:hypothetical protein
MRSLPRQPIAFAPMIGPAANADSYRASALSVLKLALGIAVTGAGQVIAAVAFIASLLCTAYRPGAGMFPLLLLAVCAIGVGVAMLGVRVVEGVTCSLQAWPRPAYSASPNHPA